MRKLFLIFSLFGLLGCAEEKKKLPAGLIPPAKLTSILADIHIAEVQVEDMGLTPDTAKVVFEKMQGEVLKKHGVSEKVFDKTYSYYLNNLNELDKIYERLVDTLNMREVKFTSAPRPAGQPADTVKQQPAPDTVMPDTTKISDPAALRRAKLRRLK